MKYRLTLSIVGCLLALSLGGCDTTKPRFEVEYYKPAMRQLPTEPQYSRTTWSQLPEPMPEAAPSDAPMIAPKVDYAVRSVTVCEAIDALADSMGYRPECPISQRMLRITVQNNGSPAEIAKAIGQQAGINVVLDSQMRVVRVVDDAVYLRPPQ